MRVQPFSKAAQPAITRAVVSGAGWQGSRNGYRIRIYRRRAELGPQIEYQLCIDRTWETHQAETVAQALEDLNNALMRRETRPRRRRPAAA